MLQYQSKGKRENNQSLYVGIDVGKANWLVTIMTNEMEIKTMTSAANPKKLADYLKKAFKGYTINSVYEAGYCGFWIHDELVKNGIKNIIVNPADVPRSNKEKKTKTDKIDSRTLARTLRAGILTGIHVPEEEMVSERNILRLRETLVKDQTRAKNRIKSLMSSIGVEVEGTEKNWSKGYIEKLSKIEMKEGNKLKLDMYIVDLKRKKEDILQVTRKIRELAKTDKYKEGMKILMSVPGIGSIWAMVILTEIGDINRFRRFDYLNNYVGLIPTEHSSGVKEKKGHINPRGNKRLKNVIVEAAWIAIRTDEALKKEYQRLIKRMSHSRAIIVIGRKLLSSIYHIMKLKETYKSQVA